MKRILAVCLVLSLFAAMLTGCSARTVFGGAEGAGWTVGFGKAELIPPDRDTKTYYMAGYRNGYPARSIMDPQMARAVWLDDGTGRGGVVLVEVDCVGLASPDTDDMRRMLSDFVRETGCRAIHIMSTHTHAGVDTLGLWGPMGASGRDEDFMAVVKAGVCQAVLDAWADARPGTLAIGSAEVPGDLLRDARDPQVYDETLTRIRFMPDDGSRPLYLMFFSAHPEALRSSNNMISADFPCYMGQRIAERTGAEFIFFTGAIGGLISTFPVKGPSGETLADISVVKQTGYLLGDIACDISQEQPLPPRLDIATKQFTVPLDNTVLMLASFLGVIVKQAVPGGGQYGLSITTQLSYMELGGQKILLIPGELFPELAFGGALEMGDAGPASMNPPTLAEILGTDNFLVVGLADDELGYIIPPNDFVLNEETPYFERADGRRHYEETNSVGPEMAACIAQALQQLLEEIGR